MNSKLRIKLLTAIATLLIGLVACPDGYAHERSVDGRILEVAIEAYECVSCLEESIGGGGYVMPATEVHILDFSGKEITEECFDETAGYYTTCDWESLLDYYKTRVQAVYIIKDTIEPKGMDLAKTRIVQANVQLSSQGYDVFVEYTVRGTIYYNPNTFIISSASTPIRTSLMLYGPTDLFQLTTYYETANSSIASNGLSATFNYSFKVKGVKAWGDQSVVEFGTVSKRFTITPD